MHGVGCRHIVPFFYVIKIFNAATDATCLIYSTLRGLFFRPFFSRPSSAFISLFSSEAGCTGSPKGDPKYKCFDFPQGLRSNCYV